MNDGERVQGGSKEVLTPPLGAGSDWQQGMGSPPPELANKGSSNYPEEASICLQSSRASCTGSTEAKHQFLSYRETERERKHECQGLCS